MQTRNAAKPKTTPRRRHLNPEQEAKAFFRPFDLYWEDYVLPDWVAGAD